MATNETALTLRAEDVPQVSAFGSGSEAFQTAQRMAKALASSSIVPAAYQGNVANVMVAMEYANRIGASVLAVMQNLDVIHGRPALRATFLIATVNASGRFTPIRFRWQGNENTDAWGCRAVAVDRESGEECVGPLVTIGLAKGEGWTSKSGSKWKTLPELMLMYRSAAFWARVYAPEISLGMQTTDEVEDVGPSRQYGPANGGGAAALNARLGMAAVSALPPAAGPSLDELVAQQQAARERVEAEKQAEPEPPLATQPAAQKASILSEDAEPTEEEIAAERAASSRAGTDLFAEG